MKLRDFYFNNEYIQGKANIAADALSRIVTSFEELKSKSVFVVNTRAMTKKKI